LVKSDPLWSGQVKLGAKLDQGTAACLDWGMGAVSGEVSFLLLLLTIAETVNF
jgi:hypothetical protein